MIASVMQGISSAPEPGSRSAENRVAGLLCVALGSAILLWWGLTLQFHASSSMVDFRVMYYNAKILLNHKDPYKTINGEQLAREEGDKPRVDPIPDVSEITCVYPPSALLVSAPIALLSRAPAKLVWAALNGGGIILSGFLVWELAASSAPLFAGILIGFLLANSAGLLFQGNVAGIVVSLCVVATWCFYRERYIPMATIFLAVSIAIKPHDSGMILLLLLAHPRQRHRAVAALLLTAVLVGIGIVWVSQVAPGWRSELTSNLVSVSARGTGNDPGPASGSRTIINSDVNLQTIVAVLKDEPAFYNPVSYVFCLSLMVLWIIPAWRVPMTPFRFWIAAAFMSALTLLPVYHRHHDAKLLLLAVPGCALVWSSSNTRLRLAIAVVTASAIAATADLPRVILTIAESPISLSTATITGKFMTILLARPAPFSISLMAIFYLYLFWRDAKENDMLAHPGTTS